MPLTQVWRLQMKHVLFGITALILSQQGQAQVQDVRDDACRVVLESAQLSCVRSNCTLVTRVFVRRDLGAAPQVLARYVDTGEWTTSMSRYQPGYYGDYDSYQIDLYAGGAGFPLEFIPFVEVDGLRYFDHNVLKGDLENYRMGSGYPGIYRNAAAACGL